MFRDKRVRMTALITPVVMMFIFMYLFGFLQQTVGGKQNVRVHLVRGSEGRVDQTTDPAETLKRVLAAEHYKVIEVKSLKEGENMIKLGEAQVVLEASSLEEATKAKQIIIQ